MFTKSEQDYFSKLKIHYLDPRIFNYSSLLLSKDLIKYSKSLSHIFKSGSMWSRSFTWRNARKNKKPLKKLVTLLFILVILTPHSGHTDPPVLRWIFEDKILKNDQWLFVSVKLFFFVFLSQRFSF